MKQPNARSTGRPTQDRSRVIQGHSAIGRTSVISQDLLATLRRRKAEMEEAEQSYAEVRKAIIDLDAAGARTEPGPLAFQISPSKTHHFNTGNLTAILGKDEVDALRKLIPPTLRTILRVIQAPNTKVDNES